MNTTRYSTQPDVVSAGSYSGVGADGGAPAADRHADQLGGRAGHLSGTGARPREVMDCKYVAIHL